MKSVRLVCWLGCLLSFWLLFSQADLSFAQSPTQLANGSMEQATDGHPTGWFYPARLNGQGYTLTLDKNDPAEGTQSALIDSTQANNISSFGMLNFVLDPEKFRGKRVRFRAAVRTADRSNQGRAQLWLRVDRKTDDGKTAIGAFDNMQRRPIVSDNWNHFEIVADIEKDAMRMTVGMLVLGKCKAWLDDASLEVVDNDVNLTTMDVNRGRLAATAKAPTQPFFNHWLWLAVLVLILFLLSQTKNSFIQRFALRFSLVYWLIYSFPSPFTDVIRGVLGLLSKVGIPITWAMKHLGTFLIGWEKYTEELAMKVANQWLGIEGELVSTLQNGSGDTTVAYIQALIGVAVSLAVAIIWSLAFIRWKSDPIWLRDLLRTYLRWVLALTMLGYGLAKTGFIMTQFAQGGGPSDFQMSRTYGDSSPMGLLWTFMAVSPMYTFFAGMGEVVGGILLVFRRTMTLGALVTFGVMLNVVMLNYCYDVPVKLYSSHLLVMAILIAAPDVPRLFNVLILNRSTEPTKLLSPPYTNPTTIWFYRAFKAVVVLAVVVIPVCEHAVREIKYEHPEAVESKHLLINRGYRWINEFPFNR